jgi:chromosomal replication initiation ATPase DnaA
MSRSSPPVARSTQLPLDLPHAASFGDDDYFIADSNEAAYALIDTWPDWTGRLQTLIGPVGSGKSHLAAIWSRLADAPILKCAELNAHNVLAMHEVGALVLEDAPGDELDETALFHLLNLIADTGGSLLLTTHRSPATWTVTLPDLATRLRSLPVTHLEAPDDALLRAVLVKLFADRQVTVDEALVSYILSRTERSLAAIRNVVQQLDQSALAEKAAITRPFAARILRDPRTV